MQKVLIPIKALLLLVFRILLPYQYAAVCKGGLYQYRYAKVRIPVKALLLLGFCFLGNKRKQGKRRRIKYLINISVCKQYAKVSYTA
jgi:hypothetical protein